MGNGLMLATLATMIGKPLAARYGKRRVTICAAGRRSGEPFVMGTFTDGSIVLGQPDDFTLPPKRKARTRKAQVRA